LSSFNIDVNVQQVFYLLFWALLCIIFLNVIFGVIVDTFADLRDKNKVCVCLCVFVCVCVCVCVCVVL
jgi:hypothetical protein